MKTRWHIVPIFLFIVFVGVASLCDPCGLHSDAAPTANAATFQTTFDAGQINRTENIATALRAIDGKIINPGEVFSFNKTTGRRIEANGYKESTIISNGIYKKGDGGGVCQVSTTLFNAAALSGLDIIEANPHSVPVSYVAKGRDAMVNFGSSDLKIRNPFPEPVMIDAKKVKNTAVISFLGLPEDSLVYKLKVEATQTAPIPEKQIIKNKGEWDYLFERDSDVLEEEPIKTLKRVRIGTPGWKTETWRMTYEDGVEKEREVLCRYTYRPYSDLWVEN
ncbi:MAG: VanW family protein [Firmicutes bacterium]|nr:VanW family protein [Bacillota bacterium]